MTIGPNAVCTAVARRQTAWQNCQPAQLQVHRAPKLWVCFLVSCDDDDGRLV